MSTALTILELQLFLYIVPQKMINNKYTSKGFLIPGGKWSSEIWSTEPLSYQPHVTELSHEPPTAGTQEPWNITSKDPYSM